MRCTPFYTPYQFAGNKPIIAIDLDGLEEKITITSPNADGSLYTTKTFLMTDYALSEWNVLKGNMGLLLNSVEGNFYGSEDYASGISTDANGNYVSPATGTLNITLAYNGGVYASYDKKRLGLSPKGVSFIKSLSTSMEGFDRLFINPKTEAEKSFNNTVSAYVTGVLFAPLSAEALAAEGLFNFKAIFNFLDFASDIDEVAGGDKGSISSQYLEGTAATVVNTVKAVTSFTNKNIGINDITKSTSTSNKIKTGVNIVNDTKETITNTKEAAKSSKP